MFADPQRPAPVSMANVDDGSLRPNAAALLAYLRTRDGEVVSKQSLMDAVWPDTHVTENSLYQAVSELRRALADVPGVELQTVPRRGYRLVSDASPASVHGGRWPSWGPPLRALVAMSVAVLLVAALVGAVRFVSANAQPRASLPSVAVLPFEASDPKGRWQLFGQSMSEEVAGSLAANKWLRVHAADKAHEARFVLNGSLLTQGGQLHVNARLTDRTNGALIWAKSWHGLESGYFDLQAAVAHEVASELGGHWSGAVVRFEAGQAVRRPTDSLDAYELFLLGTRAKHRFTPESFESARRMLTRAVEIDPGFVEAWTTLSVVHNLRALVEPEVAQLQRIMAQRAKAIEAAVALAPEDPTVLMEQGWLLARQGDHAATVRAVRRAAALAPDNPDVLAYAALNGNLRVDLGKEGVDWISRAMALNPDPPPWYHIGEGLARFTARDWQGSVAAFAKAPDYVTRDLFTAVALAQSGQRDQAQAVADRLVRTYPAFRTSHYVYQEAMDLSVNGRLLIETAADLGIPRGDLLRRPASAGASLD
ncbi:winged helix-turn-helix domain-containing protein [Mameliella sediminis]|uniref:winged helix-turn-helix domain-containing protein n=1 Tax=Mameliella sediminis TaxID=2836866 RepID=UPI001C4900BD|nr:winged helix-turn-helix domain-containing protein [Mameliella sediminis]MBV7392867.1 winged helix-turn-helix domain-containing protein [Mameliella sediminis]